MWSGQHRHAMPTYHPHQRLIDAGTEDGDLMSPPMKLGYESGDATLSTAAFVQFRHDESDSHLDMRLRPSRSSDIGVRAPQAVPLAGECCCQQTPRR